MKIRNGFVSNSSSSSFLLCVKKDAYNREFKKLSKESKLVIKELYFESKVFNFETMNYSTFDSHGYCPEEELDLSDNWRDVVDDFQDKFKDGEYFSHSEDL